MSKRKIDFLNCPKKRPFSDSCRMYEYTSAANPNIEEIPIKSFGRDLYETSKTHVTKLDIFSDLKTTYSATSPNLLANFIEIVKGESIRTEDPATSNAFYVIKGKGKTFVENNVIEWKKGDIFVVPHCSGIKHLAKNSSALYWINDSPLLNYLGAVPNTPKFKITLFTKEEVLNRISELEKDPDAEKRNRLGVLLGNEKTENSTKTLTHVLWSLLNVINPKLVQKPHRHNSVALDLCISAKKGVYTLIGKELNEDGTVKDPIRCNWEPGSVFITPPGLWHSHHNESDEPAWVLPIQDAGLHTYLRTLDIKFS